MLEAAFLDEVKERGDQAEEECGVGGEQERDVEEDPAAVEDGEGGGLLARMERGDEAKEEADGQDEDAEGDGFVAPVDEKEGRSKE